MNKNKKKKKGKIRIFWIPLARIGEISNTSFYRERKERERKGYW